jgi:F-type H+-transporting ATPase subunit a
MSEVEHVYKPFDPLDHVADHAYLHMETPFFNWHIPMETLTSTNDFMTLRFPNAVSDALKLGKDFDFTFSAKTSLMVGFIWISAILLIWLVLSAAKANNKDRTKAPKGWGNMVEMFVLFVRDEIVYPNCGKKAGRVLLPFFLTCFFFIAVMNYVGMLPFAATPTNQYAVTFVLAAMAYMMMFFGGFIVHGPHFLHRVVPIKLELNAMLPIMIPIWVMLWVLELIMGMVIKSFALMVRLKANMTAGHIVIFSLLLLPFTKESYGMGALGSVLSLLVMMIEILVCILQAYVFTLLAAIFIGHSVNKEEHH